MMFSEEETVLTHVLMQKKNYSAKTNAEFPPNPNSKPVAGKSPWMHASVQADNISALFLAMTHQGTLLLAEDPLPLLPCFP